jgi:hypothetical protein
MDFPFDIPGILQNVSKISLRGGVVGKVSITVMVVALAMAAIAWPVRNVWLSLAALVFVFLLAFVLLWRLIDFAGKNPEAALLEGSELVLMKQMERERLGSDTKQMDPNVIEAQLLTKPGAEEPVVEKPPEKADAP